MKFILGSIPNGAGTMVLWFLCLLFPGEGFVRVGVKPSSQYLKQGL